MYVYVCMYLSLDSQEVSQQDNNRNAIHLAAVAKGSDEEFRYMMDSLKINMDFRYVYFVLVCTSQWMYLRLTMYAYTYNTHFGTSTT